jgi:serine/threonine-protein kinase HipA
VVVDALLDEAGYIEFVRRVALIVASGNNDAHLKNWSLLYKDGVTPSLTPLYDQVATVAWPKLDLQHALTVGGVRDFARVSSETIKRLARKIGRDPEETLEVVRATISDLRFSWAALVSDAPMVDGQIAALRTHWRDVPLLREAGELGGR